MINIIKENNKLIKEILPNKLYSNSDDNIKPIKRNLNIYNLVNETNYKLSDIGLTIKYNPILDNRYIFYYHKIINEIFNIKLIKEYRKNYDEAWIYLKIILDESTSYYIETKNKYCYYYNDELFLEQKINTKKFKFINDITFIKLSIELEYNRTELKYLLNNILKCYFNYTNCVIYLSY